MTWKGKERHIKVLLPLNLQWMGSLPSSLMMQSVLSFCKTAYPTAFKEKYSLEAPKDIHPYENVTSWFVSLSSELKTLWGILLSTFSVKAFFMYILPPAEFRCKCWMWKSRRKQRKRTKLATCSNLENGFRISLQNPRCSGETLVSEKIENLNICLPNGFKLSFWKYQVNLRELTSQSNN